MGKEYSIPIVADVGKFIKGTDDIEDALDHVADSLDHVADLSDAGADQAAESMDNLADSAREAGQGIETSADDGRRAIKGLADDTKDSARQIETATKDTVDGFDEIGDAAKDAGRDVEKAAKDAAKDLDEIGDGAKDQAREVERQGEKIEDSLDEIAKGADTSAEKSQKSFSDAWRQMRADAEKAARDIEAETDDVGENAFDGLKEEAGDSARESAASFTGEFDEVGDFIQEVMANAFQTAGPLGMGAGLAMAAMFGIGIAKIQEEADRRATAIEARFEDMAENMSSSLSFDFVDEGVKGILNDSEDALISFADAQHVAARTGLDLSTVLRAYAGSATDAEEVSRRLGPTMSSNQDGMNQFRETLSFAAEATDIAREKFEAYEGTQQGAGATLRTTADSIGNLADKMREQRDAAEEAREASADLYESQANLNDIYNEAVAAIEANAASGLEANEVMLDQKAAVAGSAQEYQGYLELLAQSGASASDVQAEYERLTGKVRDLGGQANLSEKDIESIIGTIMEVPTHTNIGMGVTGDQEAKARIHEIMRTIRGVPDIGIGARVTTPWWEIYNQAYNLARISPVINVLARVSRII